MKTHNENLFDLLEYTVNNVNKLLPEEIKHEYDDLYKISGIALTFNQKDLEKHLYSINSHLSLRDIDYVIRLIDSSTDFIEYERLKSLLMEKTTQ